EKSSGMYHTRRWILTQEPGIYGSLNDHMCQSDFGYSVQDGLEELFRDHNGVTLIRAFVLTHQVIPLQTSVMAPIDVMQPNVEDELQISRKINEITRKTSNNIVNVGHEMKAEEFACVEYWEVIQDFNVMIIFSMPYHPSNTIMAQSKMSTFIPNKVFRTSNNFRIVVALTFIWSFGSKVTPKCLQKKKIQSFMSLSRNVKFIYTHKLRRKEDAWINNYHPELLRVWTEPEGVDSGIAQAIQQIQREESDISRKLFRICMKILHERQVSAAECAYRIKPEQRYRVLQFDRSGHATGYCSNIFESLLVQYLPYFSETELLQGFDNAKDAFLARENRLMEINSHMRQHRERDQQLGNAFNQINAFEILEQPEIISSPAEEEELPETEMTRLVSGSTLHHEISMVPYEMLCMIDSRLRQLKSPNAFFGEITTCKLTRHKPSEIHRDMRIVTGISIGDYVEKIHDASKRIRAMSHVPGEDCKCKKQCYTNISKHEHHGNQKKIAASETTLTLTSLHKTSKIK
ncbi:hypothetical protein L9F63_007880, partial [Diploptera punctata]